MAGLAALVKSAGLVGIPGLFDGNLAKVARVATNMRSAQFTEEETLRIVKALYLSENRMDAREAWAVLDRRNIGSLPRDELEDTLVVILGDRSSRRIKHLMDLLPSKSSATLAATAQLVDFAEFFTLLPQLAKLHSDSGSLSKYVATEVVHAAATAGESLVQAGNAWTMLDLETLGKLPPLMTARAGGVVHRMLAAGYSRQEACIAVDALYCTRDQRHLARLWGIFDVRRTGSISVTTFDMVLPLFTEAIYPADVPNVRMQMGFVDPKKVTYREFEASLRLLVPPDGSPPQLGATNHDSADLVDILGSSANVSRLKPYQRQRATRLALRMKNFGYSSSAIATLCRTLFLTKLHDRDLWQIWHLLQLKPMENGGSGGGQNGIDAKAGKGKSGNGGGGGGVRTERPLDVEQVRHFLALLSEANKSEQVDRLLTQVDANGSGDVEFEELATLIRAINPQLARQRELTDVTVEAHPLLLQVQQLMDDQTWDLMYATPTQLESAVRRANKLASVVRRFDGTSDVGLRASGSDGNGNAGGGGKGIDRSTLSMIHEVANEQLASAAEGEQRGSLRTYCADAHAQCLACFAQALHHAADLLATHGIETYEAHVALRTVRTVEQAERLHPQRRIDWRMEAPKELKQPTGSDPKAQTSGSLAEQERQRLCLSFAEGGGIRNVYVPPDRKSRAARSLSAASGSTGGVRSSPEGSTGAGRSRHSDESMRSRAAEIYRNKDGKEAAAAAHKAPQDEGSAEERKLALEADEAVKEAMGLLNKVGAAEKESASGIAHRKRVEMINGESCAAKVAEAMSDEKPEVIRRAAKVHQRAIQAKDLKTMLRNKILGVLHE